MKRIAYILFAVLLFSSCDDFLSFDPLTQKTSANYPANEAEVNQVLAGIYTTMTNEQRLADQSYWFVMEVASDEKLGGGGMNDLKALSFESFMYSDPEMLAPNWQTSYMGIHRANYAIEKIPLLSDDVVSPAKKNQALGEAYFLRAFLYHRLATLYGSVPLKLTTEVQDLGGAEPDEIWAQIASDLKNAIELMPANSYTSTVEGHATRWAAQAMMARAWLFYTGFYGKQEMPLAGGGNVAKNQVIAWLEELVEKSGHRLVDDFHRLWPYTNSLTIGDYDYMVDYSQESGKSLNELIYVSNEGARNPETIFALQFNVYAGWGIDRGYSNTIMLFSGLRGQQKSFPFAGGWGQGNSVPKHIWDEWAADEPDDARRTASVIDIEAELSKNNYQRGQWDFVLESNYWGKKYNGVIHYKEDGTLSNDYGVTMYGNVDNDQLSHTDDLVFIRYADVLLMLAELKKDVSYINEVRERAGLEPLAAYSLEALQKERRYELAFEALRYNDMRRWGADYAKAALEKQNGSPVYNFGGPATFDVTKLNPKGYSQRYDETKGFFPIPQSQINLSNGLLKQVPGWTTADMFKEFAQ